MKERELGITYKDGEIICNEGGKGNKMYVIQSGKVNVIKKNQEGKFSLSTLKEGEIFGEMALFDRLPRSATVKAMGETRILTIDKKGFFLRISKDPTLAFKILESMSKRIRKLDEELSNLKKEGKGTE